MTELVPVRIHVDTIMDVYDNEDELAWILQGTGLDGIEPALALFWEPCPLQELLGPVRPPSKDVDSAEGLAPCAGSNKVLQPGESPCKGLSLCSMKRNS